MLTERQALSKALDMLAAISAGKSYNTRDFYMEVTKLEIALQPTSATGNAFANFAKRTECSNDCSTFGMCRHNVNRPE
jgi:hypothetical protein